MHANRIVAGALLSALVTLASGCATTENMEQARMAADEAKAAAAAAQQALGMAQRAQTTADEANRTANAALRAANEAQRCCDANSEKMDRMFKQMMKK